MKRCFLKILRVPISNITMGYTKRSDPHSPHQLKIYLPYSRSHINNVQPQPRKITKSKYTSTPIPSTSIPIPFLLIKCVHAPSLTQNILIIVYCNICNICLLHMRYINCLIGIYKCVCVPACMKVCLCMCMCTYVCGTVSIWFPLKHLKLDSPLFSYQIWECLR